MDLWYVFKTWYCSPSDMLLINVYGEEEKHCVLHLMLAHTHRQTHFAPIQSKTTKTDESGSEGEKEEIVWKTKNEYKKSTAELRFSWILTIQRSAFFVDCCWYYFLTLITVLLFFLFSSITMNASGFVIRHGHWIYYYIFSKWFFDFMWVVVSFVFCSSFSPLCSFTVIQIYWSVR